MTVEEQYRIRNPGTPILFVDDDPIAHRILHHHLKEWRLECFYTAKEALRALEEKNFVIVITDLVMPEMDGLELICEIKKRYGNRVQIVVVTASQQQDDLIRSFEAGATDFLLKPFKGEELQEVLEHILLRIRRWNRAKDLLVSRKKKEAAGRFWRTGDSENSSRVHDAHRAWRGKHAITS